MHIYVYTDAKSSRDSLGHLLTTDTTKSSSPSRLENRKWKNKCDRGRQGACRVVAVVAVVAGILLEGQVEGVAAATG